MAYGFMRIGDEFETRLEQFEITMVRQLLDELCELLTPPEEVDPANIDPLARELGLEDLALCDDSTQIEDPAPPGSPVLERLLPAGYREDPIAAIEFRRYTDGALRRTKIADAEIVIASLDVASTQADGAIRVSDDAAPAWMRAINDLRLALGVQLGLTDAAAAELIDIPDDDPRAAQAAIYDFLTWWQDSLVQAVLEED